MPKIIAQGVSVEFPVISPSSRSFRNVALLKASRVGGRVVEGNTSIKLVRALDDISFTLSDGDRLGLMGHNGSGKTTLIRTLSGIYEPAGGQLAVEGKRFPMFDINLGLDEEATGYENIYIRGLIMGMSAKEISEKTQAIAEYSELESYLDMPIRTYSSGMLLRLMFAIATSTEGDIVLMDEWIAAGDDGFRQKANERLREITTHSGILVLASHDVNILKATCNLGLCLEGGKVRHFGPIDEVIAAMHAGSCAAA